MFDHRPEREMVFRYYRPEDREVVIAIFKEQGLNVRLPLPGEDPATAIGLVGEEDGKVKVAFFLRASLELHAVIAPDEPNQAYKLRRIGYIAEGAALELGRELAKLKLPVFVDVIAFVPRSMGRMLQFLKEHLGFVDETPDFLMLWKRLGR